MMIGAALVAGVVFAQDAQSELEEQEADFGNNWRITVGGFGRGNMKTTLTGLGDDRATAYGIVHDMLSVSRRG